MTVHVDRAGTRHEWPRKPYCADAGIPPPPPEREWWIVRPCGLSDSQFFAALNAFVMREAAEPTAVAGREAVGLFLSGVFG